MIERFNNIIGILALIAGLFFVNANPAYAVLSGIIHNPDAVSDTVQFSYSIVGSTSYSTFYLKNTGDKTLKLGPRFPSLSIEQPDPQHPLDKEEFYHNIANDSLTIEPNDSVLVVIRYEASKDTNTYPFGQRVARLRLGLYDSGINTPSNVDNYTVYKEFILIAYKVKHFISGNSTFVNIDSVYVNPADTVFYTWKISNASQYDLTLDTQKTSVLTPVIFTNEMTIENKLPVVMPAHSGPINWKIAYFPKDLGEDRTIFSLGYKFDDTLDFTSVEVRGVGVQQKLAIVESDAVTNLDTIDFGYVRIDETKEIFVKFGNDGNLNFRAEEQKIFDMDSDIESDYFHISEPIDSTRYYVPTQGGTFKLSFTPDKNRVFLGKYKINSDIVKRNIRGIPPSNRTVEFYLRGIGMESILSTVNTADFGIIVQHPDCPSSRSFTLLLNNTGNSALQIKGVECPDPFKYVYFNNEPVNLIQPQKTDSILIVFTPNSQDKYSSHILFLTNSKPPNDSVFVYLKAERADPDNIWLRIDTNLRIKPGNMISIPIRVNSDLIGRSRTFRTELTYNKSLMRYSNYDKLGTASENTDDSDITIKDTNDGGKLLIYLETPSINTFFLDRDILINLNFNTYIGNKLSDAIAFINPLFGDGACDKVLLPLETNGILTIDSICDLNLLLLPNSGVSFHIDDIHPNPVNDKFKLKYELKYDTDLEIIIYNELGLPVDKLFDGKQDHGIYEINYNCNLLNNGIYYIKFSNGILTTVRKLVVNK